MSRRIIPAIMSGGAGTRLWPLSTEARPKQFHALVGADSLFTQTVQRVSGEAEGFSFAPPIVLCNVRHAGLVQEHLGQTKPAAIVLEPESRNTAAVGAVAAAVAAALDPAALVLLLPADHVIADLTAFRTAVARGAVLADEHIVTFGVAPTHGATGYGYIKSGVAMGDGVFAVDAFREKPSQDEAQAYLAVGGHWWNAGIFLFSPQMLLQEFHANAEIRDRAIAALAKGQRTGFEIRLDAHEYARAPSLPLDIAVMEKTARAAVVPCEMGWADIGSWDELWRLSGRDSAGNALRGDAIVQDASNNIIRSEGVPIRVAGVSDLIVVATPEGVLVLPRSRAQDVKRLRAAD